MATSEGLSEHANLCSPAPYEPSVEVIKLEFVLRLKIKRNDLLLADMCPQAANPCALF